MPDFDDSDFDEEEKWVWDSVHISPNKSDRHFETESW